MFVISILPLELVFASISLSAVKVIVAFLSFHESMSSWACKRCLFVSNKCIFPLENQ